MAKRFTDTSKWAKDSFSEMSLKMKLVWVYLCDNCDHAGIWDVNLNLMSFQIGEKVTLSEITDAFGKKVLLFDKKIHIPSFVTFQYGTLNAENKVHKSVISRLEKIKNQAPCKPLASPLIGAKDKDKDKEKYKDKIKDKETDKDNYDFESIYLDYPRKEGKARGFDTLRKTILTQQQYDELRQAVKNYADECRLTSREKRYIRQFSSFIGPAAEPFWRDWIEWSPNVTMGTKTRSTQIQSNLDILEAQIASKDERDVT